MAAGSGPWTRLMRFALWFSGLRCELDERVFRFGLSLNSALHRISKPHLDPG
jgi:hypothetical protein